MRSIDFTLYNIFPTDLNAIYAGELWGTADEVKKKIQIIFFFHL